MFVMLFNAMKKLGLTEAVGATGADTVDAGAAAANEIGDYLYSYSDADQVSDYARSAMAAFIRDGIVTGKGNGALDPKGVSTRAEAAQLICNMLKGDAELLQHAGLLQHAVSP